jgi:hypothetical protein
MSWEWFDAHDSILCPFCKETVNLVNVHLDGDPTEEELRNLTWRWKVQGYFYLAPVLRCSNCQTALELFYPNLPETDLGGRLLLGGTDPPVMPPEEWHVIFGCLECGHVEDYGAAQVTTKPLLKTSRGLYQSGKGVCFVEFPCADKDCKAPFSMYVDTGERNLSAVVQTLRQAHFQHTLPCGHALMPAPEKYYRVHPVKRRLW